MNYIYYLKVTNVRRPHLCEQIKILSYRKKHGIWVHKTQIYEFCSQKNNRAIQKWKR